MDQTTRPSRISVWGGLLLSIATGLLMPVGYPPFRLWGLHLFSLIPLLAALSQTRRPADSILMGLSSGCVAIGTGYFWLTRFSEWSGSWSYAFWVVLVLYQIPFFGLIVAVFSWVRRSFGVEAALLSFPFAWTVFEFLATFGPFGIPEWLGHGQLGNPVLRPTARSLGVTGLSFAVGLFGAIAVLLLQNRGKPSRPAVAGAGFLLVALLGSFAADKFGKYDPVGSLKVALVQPVLDPVILNDGTRGQEVLQSYVDETLRLIEAGEPPELLLWSEMVFPYSFNVVGPTRKKMSQTLSDYRGELILGGPQKLESRYFNAAYLVTNGETVDVYQKGRLFPFGEYTPLRGLLGFVRDDLPQKLRAQDYSFGTDTGPLISGKGPIGISICFESTYTDLIRKQVGGGAQLLANLTNDGWFAGSAVEEHHIFVSSLRAVENRRYLLQVASSGISAVVDDDGNAILRTEAGRPRSLRADVPLIAQKTIFTRIGYFRFAVLAFLNLCLLAAARRRAVLPSES